MCVCKVSVSVNLSSCAVMMLSGENRIYEVAFIVRNVNFRLCTFLIRFFFLMQQAFFLHLHLSEKFNPKISRFSGASPSLPLD